MVPWQWMTVPWPCVILIPHQLATRHDGAMTDEANYVDDFVSWMILFRDVWRWMASEAKYVDDFFVRMIYAMHKISRAMILRGKHPIDYP